MTSVSTDVRPPTSQNQTIVLTTMIAMVTTGNVRVGTLSLSGITGRSLPDQERHKRLLGVEAVLRLVPNGRLRAVEHVLRDLLAVVRGKTVEDDRVVARTREQLRVDPVAGQVAQPLLPLG